MRQKGHSLIEVLVVLGVATLLFLSGAPSILSLHDFWSLHGEASRFAGVLEQSRIRAVLSNTNVRVSSAGDSYHVRQADTEDKPFSLNSGVRFDGQPKFVSFSSMGTASPGATFTLVHKSKRVMVVVSPAGRVRVDE